MKFLHRPSAARMHRQDQMKASAYAFVPNQTHFGELCGFADDIVYGGQGFGMHPHRDMEISTIVTQGAQAHRDSTGAEGLVDTLTVQTMSAGTGIQHSEFNASQTEPFHSYQIWVYPKQLGVPPRHDSFRYSAEQKHNRVLLAISPDGRDGSARTNQDAFFSLSRVDARQSLDYRMHQAGQGVYIHCAEGSVTVGPYTLAAGDALGVYDTEHISLKAEADAELIWVEVPMQRGVRV